MNENIKHSEHDEYEILVGGHLDEDWTDWFDGLSITCEADFTTRLAGPFVDQAALFSLLRKIRDTDLKLLSLRLVVRAKAQSTETQIE